MSIYKYLTDDELAHQIKVCQDEHRILLQSPGNSIKLYELGNKIDAMQSELVRREHENDKT